MSPHPHPDPRRRRRRALAGRAVGLAAALLGVAGATLVVPTGPAGAAPAPLATPDAVGIRVDETALLGPVLEQVEADLTPLVEAIVLAAAAPNPGLPGYDQLTVDLGLELGLDVRPPSSYAPHGSISVAAVVDGPRLAYTYIGAGCTIEVDGDGITVAEAAVDTLPAGSGPPAAAPFTTLPTLAWWLPPTVSVPALPCFSLLQQPAFDTWLDQFFDPTLPTSPVAQIEQLVGAATQDLVEDLWAAHVDPVLQSLSAFDLDMGQPVTDTHGLMVTADADASAGLVVPGLGGPHGVGAAEDSGTTSSLATLLADRIGATGPREVIVSIHPNLANQAFTALTTALGGTLSTVAVPASTVEPLLLPPAARPLYADADWTVRLQAAVPPEAHPVAPSGAPELDLPQVTVTFLNGATTVATFTGSLAGIPLTTQVRPGGTAWTPDHEAAAATAALRRTQANVHAAQLPPQPSAAVAPHARSAWDALDDTPATAYAELSPTGGAYGWAPVDLCTTCGRSAGDERYTETFEVA
ncbi:MAG TPA: hypothetical protein VEW93_04205 [Acidimicrobiales bacterium]|nr:hypothetical protein [Acidimicrobiales bacterium]